MQYAFHKLRMAARAAWAALGENSPPPGHAPDVPPAPLAAACEAADATPAEAPASGDPSGRRHLLAALAHEFNNCLTVIDGYSAILLADPPEDPATLRALEEIQRAAQRASKLTRQMQAFARRQVLRPTAVELAGLLPPLREWLAAHAGPGVRLEMELPSAPCLVCCDPVGLEQMLRELCLFCLENLRGAGGELTLAAEPGPLGGRLRVTQSLPLAEPGAVDSLFDPFLHIQPLGKGAGLGLAAAAGFVKQSGGAIQAQPDGDGLSLIVDLPDEASLPPALRALLVDSPADLDVDDFDEYLSPEPTSPPRDLTTSPPVAASVVDAGEFAPRRVGTPAEGTSRTPMAEAATLHGELAGLRVLLVEDEEFVRYVIAQILHRQGVRVTEAVDGESALRLAEEADEPIDVLLSDISMPGMDGLELYTRLNRAQPDLRVIFISGYTRETMDSEAPLPQGCGFLNKPFSSEQLLAALEGVLQRS